MPNGAWHHFWTRLNAMLPISDGPEMFPRHRVVLIEGRDLTWYGPSLVTATAWMMLID
jgi:hypothetical protein